MALEEIAVADIRKGQTVLVLFGKNDSSGVYEDSTVVISVADGQLDSWGHVDSDVAFYLLAEAPTTPPFEVPWGTLQRDKDGHIWEFFNKIDVCGNNGNIGRRCNRMMGPEKAEQLAPFTRLYTVQELANRLHDIEGSWGSTERRLRELHSRGDI